MEFEGIAQIIKSLVFSRALARDINVNALGDIPFTFLPDTG